MRGHANIKIFRTVHCQMITAGIRRKPLQIKCIAEANKVDKFNLTLSFSKERVYSSGISRVNL